MVVGFALAVVSPLHAYIDAPAEKITLPKLMLEFRSCGIYRVDWIDAEHGAVRYQLTEVLQGNPEDSQRHVLRLGGKLPEFLADIAVGDSAVLFGPDPYHRGLGFAHGGWYVSNHERATGWWRIEYTAAYYDFGCAFSGTLPQLVECCKSLLDGEPVTVPCHRKPKEPGLRWVSCSLRDPKRVTEVPEPTMHPASAATTTSAASLALANEPATVLLEKLRATDGRTRVAAARALGERHEGSESLIAGLIHCLTDKDPFAGRAAAIALGKLGVAARDAVPALLAAMHDGYANASDMAGWEASRAVLKIDPEGTVWLATLRGQLGDARPEQRSKAARALGILGRAARPATPSLVAALKDTDADVRYCTARALDKLEADPALVAAPLVAMLDDSSSDVRDPVTTALRNMGSTAAGELGKALVAGNRPLLRRRAANMLREMGEGAKPAADALQATAVDADEEVRLPVREALRRLHLDGSKAP